MRDPKILAAALLLGLSLSACATEKYVNQKVDVVQGEVNGIKTQLGGDEGQIAALKGQLSEQDGKIGAADRTAHEALDRAIAAGKLAEGKFVYGMVLTDDSAKFKTGSAKLSDDTVAKLNDLAAKLKADNRNVYVEIQGYTDNTGKPAANLKLGQDRADAARRVLNKAGVALNRVSTISYGEDDPVAPNKTRAGRAQNRRIVVIVLN